MTRALSATLVAVVIAACGGSPTPPPETTNDRPADAAVEPLSQGSGTGAPGDVTRAEDEEVGNGSGATRDTKRPSEPPPPPVGEPPAWLSAAMPAYQRGAILRHLQRCTDERGYLDVAGLVAGEHATVSRLADTFAAAEGGGDQRAFAAIKKVAQKAGVDIFQAVQEVAGCERSGPDLVVIGFTTAKPVEIPLLIQEVQVAIGERPGRVERQGNVSMLIDGSDEILAQIGPTMVMIGDKETILAAARAPGGARPAVRHIAEFKDDNFNLTVSDKAGVLDVVATITNKPSSGEKPKEVQAGISRALSTFGDKFAKTPLAALGARLKAAKVTVQGNRIVVQGTLPRSELGSLLRTAASLSPSDLERMIEGRDEERVEKPME
jgi:hypothetical protein